MLTTILTVRYRVFSPPIAEFDSFSHRGDVRVSTKYNVTDKRVYYAFSVETAKQR